MIPITAIQPVKEFWIESYPFASPCSYNDGYRHQIYKQTGGTVEYKKDMQVNGSVAWPLCVFVDPSKS